MCPVVRGSQQPCNGQTLPPDCRDLGTPGAWEHEGVLSIFVSFPKPTGKSAAESTFIESSVCCFSFPEAVSLHLRRSLTVTISVLQRRKQSFCGLGGGPADSQPPWLPVQRATCFFTINTHAAIARVQTALRVLLLLASPSRLRAPRSQGWCTSIVDSPHHHMLGRMRF